VIVVGAVLMAMQDSQGSKEYDSPMAKIAGSCLVPVNSKTETRFVVRSSKDLVKAHVHAVAAVLISQHRNPYLTLRLILQLNRLPLG
jgi:hypothetical protein